LEKEQIIEAYEKAIELGFGTGEQHFIETYNNQ